MQRTEGRPIGVMLIAILLALNGIVALLGALVTFGPTPAGIAGAVVAVFLGIGLLTMAYGVWTLRPWAWITTAVLEVLNAFFTGLTLLAAPDAMWLWANLILAIAIIFYLGHPEIPRVFGRGRTGF